MDLAPDPLLYPEDRNENSHATHSSNLNPTSPRQAPQSPLEARVSSSSSINPAVPRQDPPQPLHNRTTTFDHLGKSELLDEIFTPILTPCTTEAFNELENKVKTFLFAGYAYSSLYSRVEQIIDETSSHQENNAILLQYTTILSTIEQYQSGSYLDHSPSLWQTISNLFAKIFGTFLPFSTRSSAVSQLTLNLEYGNGFKPLINSYLSLNAADGSVPKKAISWLSNITNDEDSFSSYNLREIGDEHQKNPATLAQLWTLFPKSIDFPYLDKENIANLALHFTNQNNPQEGLAVLRKAKQKCTYVTEVFAAFLQGVPTDQHSTWISHLTQLDSNDTEEALKQLTKNSEEDIPKLAALWITSRDSVDPSNLKKTTIAKLAHHFLTLNQAENCIAVLTQAKDNPYFSSLEEVFSNFLDLLEPDQKPTWIAQLKTIDENAAKDVTNKLVSKQAKESNLSDLAALWNSSQNNINLSELEKEQVAKLAHHFFANNQESRCIDVLKKAEKDISYYDIPKVFVPFLELIPSDQWKKWFPKLKNISTSAYKSTLKKLSKSKKDDLPSLIAIYEAEQSAIDFENISNEQIARLALHFYQKGSWYSVLENAEKPFSAYAKEPQEFITAFLKLLEPNQQAPAFAKLWSSDKLKRHAKEILPQFANQTETFAEIWTLLKPKEKKSLYSTSDKEIDLSKINPTFVGKIAAHFFQKNDLDNCKTVLSCISGSTYSSGFDKAPCNHHQKNLFFCFLDHLDLKNWQNGYNLLTTIKGSSSTYHMGEHYAKEVLKHLSKEKFDLDTLTTIWDINQDSLDLYHMHEMTIANLAHHFLAKNRKNDCLSLFKKSERKCSNYTLNKIYLHFFKALDESQWAHWYPLLYNIDNSEAKSMLKSLVKEYQDDIAKLTTLWTVSQKTMDLLNLAGKTIAEIAHHLLKTENLQTCFDFFMDLNQGMLLKHKSVFFEFLLLLKPTERQQWIVIFLKNYHLLACGAVAAGKLAYHLLKTEGKESSKTFLKQLYEKKNFDPCFCNFFGEFLSVVPKEKWEEALNLLDEINQEQTTNALQIFAKLAPLHKHDKEIVIEKWDLFKNRIDVSKILKTLRDEAEKATHKVASFDKDNPIYQVD